jgi:hypothetical protein
MWWLLLMLTPTIVWIILDFRTQRQYRKNISKRSRGNGDISLVDTSLVDTGSIPCDDTIQDYSYSHDIGHSIDHGVDCGSYDIGDCGGHH